MGAETRKRLGMLYAKDPKKKACYKTQYEEFKEEIDAELNVSEEPVVEEKHVGRPKKGK